jgi:CDP-paratose 2-epimerase
MNSRYQRNRLKRNQALSKRARSPWLVSYSRNGQDRRPVVITGGAGFIGTNLADRLLRANRRVILYDNLSRPGVEQNLAWLRATHGERVQHEAGDVREPKRLAKVLAQASQVFHFAAQVAVTTSLNDPIEDFEINARGTLNLLEALRALNEPPPLVFTSTNKVYGEMSDVRLLREQTRYEPEEEEWRAHGFSEQRSVQFHSPYGCSKGAACQYVLDYARTYKLRTTVFRMSCIYGPHQFGTEDQGWVAHFLIKALEGSPITIYGDGRQVRDILFVEDLVDAFLLAQQNMDKISGEVFNMGGGPANTISLLEILDIIRDLCGHEVSIRYSEWRTADQQYYVSDTRKFTSFTGWKPKHSARAGVAKLYHWLAEFHRLKTAEAVKLDEVTLANAAATVVSQINRKPNGRVKRPRTGNGPRCREHKVVHLE